MSDVLIIILTMSGLMISLFLWLRSESNADRRHITEIQSADRKELLTLIKSIENHVSAIEWEVKDFHGRLCAIEERRKHRVDNNT